jgi:hypothetical protein
MDKILRIKTYEVILHPYLFCKITTIFVQVPLKRGRSNVTSLVGNKVDRISCQESRSIHLHFDVFTTYSVSLPNPLLSSSTS